MNSGSTSFAILLPDTHTRTHACTRVIPVLQNLQIIEEVLHSTYRLGRSTELSQTNDTQGWKRVPGARCKMVTHPVSEKEQRTKYCTCLDARSSSVIAGDDEGGVTVFDDGRALKRIQVLPLQAVAASTEERPHRSQLDQLTHPYTPSAYVAYVKLACDMLHAILSFGDKVVLLNLETEEVVYEFDLVEEDHTNGKVPLGPVAHADCHRSDPMKALISFHCTRTEGSMKYYEVSPAGLTSHKVPDLHNTTVSANAIYGSAPDSVVLLSTFSSINPDSDIAQSLNITKGTYSSIR